MTKRRDLKIIFHGDVWWSRSGYANELLRLIRRFLLDGWQVAQASKAGLSGHWIDYQMPEGTLRMYPSVDDPHGSDTMFYAARHFGAQVVISMIDIWVIPPQWIQNLHQIGCKWIPYMPVDASPTPPGVLQRLPFADKIITFSQFGYNQLIKHGWVSEMIHEGVDVNLLQPKDKLEAKKKIGVPQDVFLWGMIVANKENPPRKGYQEALEAFKMFYDKHPEAAMLFHVQQRHPGGFPIKEYANYLGFAKRVFFIDDYRSMFMSTSDTIAMEYNACDALLHPSQTEGFGLGIIEGEASGKPVVVQRCQSMPELIIEGKTGFAADTLYKRYTNDLSFVNVADPKSVYEAMEKTYKILKEDGKKVEKDCREWIVENFNIDRIVRDKWIVFLEALQDELLPLPLTDKK